MLRQKELNINFHAVPPINFCTIVATKTDSKTTKTDKTLTETDRHFVKIEK